MFSCSLIPAFALGFQGFVGSAHNSSPILLVLLPAYILKHSQFFVCIVQPPSFWTSSASLTSTLPPWVPSSLLSPQHTHTHTHTHTHSVIFRKSFMSLSDSIPWLVICSSCRNKVLQTGWLNPQKFPVSEFWRLEVWDQGLGRIGSF